MALTPESVASEVARMGVEESTEVVIALSWLVPGIVASVKGVAGLALDRMIHALACWAHGAPRVIVVVCATTSRSEVTISAIGEESLDAPSRGISRVVPSATVAWPPGRGCTPVESATETLTCASPEGDTMRRSDVPLGSTPRIVCEVAGTTAEASVAPWGTSPFMREACTQAATPPPSARTCTAREFSSGNHPARRTDTEEVAGTVTWRDEALRGPDAPYPSMLTTEAVGPGLDRMSTMSAPEIVAPVAIHWEVRGAAHPTALRPASSPPPCPARVSAEGMAPPLPVTDAGAGLVGADAREDQVVPAATLVVSKGSTMPEGHARRTCDG